MSESLNFINDIPCFSIISKTDKAHLITFMEVLELNKDDKIYEVGQKADYLYYVLSGSVTLKNKKEKKINSDLFFSKESIYENSIYNNTAICHEDSKIIKIHSSHIKILNKKYYNFLPKLLENFDITKFNIKSNDSKEDNLNNFPHFRNIIGWIFAFIVPLVVFSFLGESVSHSARLFLTSVSSAIVLWVFNIVPEFVPGLLIVLTSVVLGLVPSNVALSGFASETYLLILSFSGISCIVIHSGILYRFLVFLLGKLPRKQSWYDIGFLLFGSLLTPVIPSIVSRTQIASPIVTDAINILKIKKGSIFATRISASAFYGMSIFSSIVITGSIMNFIAIGLLPLQEVYQINSIGWTSAALIPGIILILTNFITLSLWFHNREKINLKNNFFEEQIGVLGKISQNEKSAIIASGLFIVGVLTMPYHQINVGWISLFMFFSLCALNILNLKKWAKSVDWSFLIFVGTVIGLAETMKFLEINEIIKDQLMHFFNFKSATPHGILTMIIAMVLILRIALPIGTTFVIMMTITIPISELFNISPWVITFTILLISDTWFFPYQSPFYTSYVRNFNGDLPYNENQFLSYNIVNNAARILSIYLSLPYWQYLGLL